MLKHFLTALQITLFSTATFAQRKADSTLKGLIIEATPKVMSMIKHTKNFTGPISDICYGIDVNVLQQTYGKKTWHQLRNYPLLGVGFTYLNYNNNAIYGQVFGISPNITIPLIRKNSWEWTLRAGMGVGYVTKYYNRKTSNNTTNVAIGGYINNVSPFSTDIRYTINEHWQIASGINFTHVSNASFQVPNLGINTWGGHIGVRYAPHSNNPDKIIHKPAPTFSNNYMGFAKVSIAFREMGVADGPTYRTYIGHIGIAKRYASKNKVYAGIDYHYHTHRYYFALNSGAVVDNKWRQAGQFAAFVGHEFIYGKFGIVGQLGYYFLPAIDQSEKLYQKIGGNFYALRKEHGTIKEVYFSAILKTHLTVAELFEMGIGISF
jgi:hypothetical protein